MAIPRLFSLSLLRIQFLQRLHQHPLGDQARAEAAHESFTWIGCVFEVDTRIPEERMKLGVMFATERHSEPGHVILAAHVVALYLLPATKDTTGPGFWARGRALSCHPVIPNVAR
jgi:hypothetical protein